MKEKWCSDLKWSYNLCNRASLKQSLALDATKMASKFAQAAIKLHSNGHHPEGSVAPLHFHGRTHTPSDSEIYTQC